MSRSRKHSSVAFSNEVQNASSERDSPFETLALPSLSLSMSSSIPDKSIYSSVLKLRYQKGKLKSTVVKSFSKKPSSVEVKKLYEIDYVGNGYLYLVLTFRFQSNDNGINNSSFQPSELNLLNPRSVNIIPNGPAALSARGLHHRSREVFTKEVKTATTNINTLTMTHSKTEKGRALVFMPIFQRAVAKEVVP